MGSLNILTCTISFKSVMQGHTSKTKTSWLRWLAVIILIVGIAFRFTNLDHKVYWHDEAFTSLHVAGYSVETLEQEVFNGTITDAGALQKYQKPAQDSSALDTVRAVATDDPQLVPLHYVITRFWINLLGYSVGIIRSFSAVISLLAFPLIYWLCLELFGSSTVGLVAIALAAVSPIHVIYAQEARTYILWIVTTLFSSASLLAALRQPTQRNWLLYTLSLILGFYSHLFFVLVAFGQGIYVLLSEKFRFSKRLVHYGIATTAGILSFAPWLWLVATSLSKIQANTGWAVGAPLTLVYFLRTRIVSLSVALFDVNALAVFQINAKFGADKYIVYLLIGICTVLYGYALYFLCRYAPWRTWLFVWLLILPTAIFLAVPDLLSGGFRSSVPRYLLPCYLGLQLAVAYCIGTLISAEQIAYSWRRFGQLTLAAVLTLGIVSCFASAQAQDWWNKVNVQRYLLASASIINQSSQPIIISNDDAVDVVSFSYLLDPKTKLLLIGDAEFPEIPDGFNSVFLFKPSESLFADVQQQQNYQMTEIIKPDRFWRGLWQIEHA